MAAILHTFNHGIMKGCLFLAVASLFYRIKSAEINSFAGLGKQMPLTMAAFMIGGLSLIGLPLTVGFISKWYLVLAMIEEGWWILAILILVSSLLAIVYIWKIIEVAYFQPMPNRPDVIKETSYHFQLPLWLLAAATIYFGVNSEVTVSIADSAAKLLIGGLK